MPHVKVHSILLLISFLALKHAAVLAYELPEEPGEEAHSSNPAFIVELGGESFYSLDLPAGKGMGGLAAIMIDVDVRISQRFWVFGAFHFDSSVWYDYMNRPAFLREEEGFAYDVELEVEEFFATWSPVPDRISFSAGRMFSVVSYANQLHLADFQFNMKPRIFTDYFGSNHGLAVDGMAARFCREGRVARTSLFVEAAKNGFEGEDLVLTTTLDAAFDMGSLRFGLRGFQYFDHQGGDHPLFIYLPQADTFQPSYREGLRMNALGGGINLWWDLPWTESLFIQAEGVSRKLGGESLHGAYAFAILAHSPKLESSFMFQQLDIPVWSGDEGMADFGTHRERAYTAGLSYYPAEIHRLRVEYSRHTNSPFYDRMILAKWTFFIDLTR